MAVYDEESQRIVVEVVYDGPALAGKTTNLKRLCSFFTEHRRSELYTTENAGERTVYLDWLQLEGGVVAGRKLRCQLITVPGQTVLSRRRWQLLKRADVIVFVLESTRRGVDDALSMVETVRRYASEQERDVPLVIQANKQDMPGALPAAEVARRLAVPVDRVVPARADSGVGVRETVVLAIRAIADLVQRRVLDEGLEALIGKAENGAQIQRLIEEEERKNPKSLLAIMMEHAPEALKSCSLVPAQAAAGPGASDSDTPEVEPAGRGSQAGSVPQKLAGCDEGQSSPGVGTPDSVHDTLPTGVRPGEARPVHLRPPTVPESLSGPALPIPTVPSGFVWPAAGGREILCQLPLSQARQRTELEGPGMVDRSERVFIYEAGTWCLKTSPRRCYPTLEQARDALVLLARNKMALRSMLVENTVLTLRSEATGSQWLWTISPWLTTLGRTMLLAKRDRDTGALEQALMDYARAVLEALKLAVRQHVQLDVHPSNFAKEGSKVVYIDDDIFSGERPPRVGHALLGSLEDFCEFPDALDAYASRLLSGLKEELRAPELALLGLRDALGATDVRSEPVRALRGRLLEIAC